MIIIFVGWKAIVLFIQILHSDLLSFSDPGDEQSHIWDYGTTTIQPKEK